MFFLKICMRPWICRWTTATDGRRRADGTDGTGRTEDDDDGTDDGRTQDRTEDDDDDDGTDDGRRRTDGRTDGRTDID